MAETKTMRLVCPNCGSDRLATVEDITGSAYGGAFVVFDEHGKEVERGFDHEGYTEVWWDSSESKAIECRDCNWQQQASNDGPALDELVLEDEDDE